MITTGDDSFKFYLATPAPSYEAHGLRGSSFVLKVGTNSQWPLTGAMVIIWDTGCGGLIIPGFFQKGLGCKIP